MPAPFPPAAAYVPFRIHNGIGYVAGHRPMRDGKAVYTGKLGREVDVPTGAKAAELTALNMLASIKAEVGELSASPGG